MSVINIIKSIINRIHSFLSPPSCQFKSSIFLKDIFLHLRLLFLRLMRVSVKFSNFSPNLIIKKIDIGEKKKN